MYITIIEKRISAKPPAQDWYVLIGSVFPFAPTTLTEIEIEPGVIVIPERVVYSPLGGTFWIELEPLLHPRPDALTIAKAMVSNACWDKAVPKDQLAAAKVTLIKEAIQKLQSTILRARPFGLPKGFMTKPGRQS